MSVAVPDIMDKPRNPDAGLDGPDYLSLVIEWEGAPVPTETNDDDAVTGKVRDWDVVDQASLESFPASDPPGWIRSHAAPTSETAKLDAEPLTPVWRLHLRKILMAVTAIGGLFALVQHVRHHRA